MKLNIKLIFYSCIALICLSVFGCKKQELAVQDPPNVIELSITGTTLTDTLEFLKDGKVIGQTYSEHGNLNVKVLVQGPDTELKIRRKGQQEILSKRTISAKQKQQNIAYYFDGDKMYTDFTQVNVKGFAQGEVEFVVEGKVVGSGNAREFPVLNIGVDAGQVRELQVRKKGTTVSLISKEIKAGVSVVNLVFYFDGEKVFEKIDTGVPANPANMIVIGSFTSKLSIFRGPADLVLYIMDLGQQSYQSTATTMRIELPEDGSFSKAIEIPPLPANQFKYYTYRIVKRGTQDELPYDLTNEIFPMLPITGFSSDVLSFTPGGSAILTITNSKEYDDWDGGTAIYTRVFDIAPYFK